MALRKVVKKRSSTVTKWLSGGGCVVREKMSEEDISCRRYRNISEKIYAEFDVLPCYDDSFLKPERSESEDFDELKGLLKDLRKFNRKNGVVPEKKKRMTMKSPRFISLWPRVGTDDEDAIKMARVALDQYKKKKGSNPNLEFLSLLQLESVHGLGDYNMIIQARDPVASGVSLKLHALCYLPRRLIRQVMLHRPLPLVNVLHKDKSKKTDLSAVSVMDLQPKDESKRTGYIEALLFANLRSCPIIDKRLGLKRQELHGDKPPRSVVKLSLDDDTLTRIAEFAVNQKPDLHFLRATGAWREKIADSRSLYHVIFEALTFGLRRRFYSALSANAKGGAAKLVDLVAVDCPRATIK